MRSLTTTSYAILGILAIRPWSAYELTGYMQTSAVRAAWPRTESRLYEEPKNLVEHGLLSATTEHTGRRSRTVYRITAKGRRALRRWLDEPAAPRQIADETLLKVLFADQGSPEQLLATIRNAYEELSRQATEVRKFARQVARGDGRFPERLHVTALAARHLIGLMRGRFEYLKWAEAWVEGWDGTAIDDDKRLYAVAMLDDAAGELDAIAGELEAKLADRA